MRGDVLAIPHSSTQMLRHVKATCLQNGSSWIEFVFVIVFKEGAYEVVLWGGVGNQSSHLPVCLVWLGCLTMDCINRKLMWVCDEHHEELL